MAKAEIDSRVEINSRALFGADDSSDVRIVFKDKETLYHHYVHYLSIKEVDELIKDLTQAKEQIEIWQK